MFILFILGIFVIIAVLVYIDQKSNYEKIGIFKITKDNGEFYFYASYFVWQKNKKRRILEEYFQGTTVGFPGEKFLITHYGVDFPHPQGISFIEREVRFWGEPLTILHSEGNKYVTINQYGSGVIDIQLNTTEVKNELINIKEYISKDIDISFDEKEVLLDFLENIHQNKSMREEEVKNACDILKKYKKYEPILSLSTNIISLIRSFLS